MKVIFSRKGFDSAAGGIPSPIFPDGRLFSVPIPSRYDNDTYDALQVSWEGESIQKVLNDISGRRIFRQGAWYSCDYSQPKQKCHHDPMWLPDRRMPTLALGQAGAADGHLRNKQVGQGDVFIFYGLFRAIECANGAWRFQENARKIHVIWAHMIVDDVLRLDSPKQRNDALAKYPFLQSHPHIDRQMDSNNSIYLSTRATPLNYEEKRSLTDIKTYDGSSKWRLPRCLNQQQAFSYLNKFRTSGEEVIVRCPGRGQEFVLNLDEVDSLSNRQAILSWIRSLTD